MHYATSKGHDVPCATRRTMRVASLNVGHGSKCRQQFVRMKKMEDYLHGHT